MATDMAEEIQQRLLELEDRIAQIEQRNRKVEADKAWEMSKTRICFVVLITYLLTALVFYLIAVPHYMQNAIIPTLGYYLSTRSLPHLKCWWQKRL